MNRIKELRIQNNMKQSDVAKLLKCATTAISKYELGQLDISSSTIIALCDIFSCTADYLLGRTVTGGLKLSPEEESTILALRRADERARSIIDVALQPFREDTAREPKAI